jgi:hypothetical protein
VKREFSQHAPLSQAIIEEKAVRLNVAVKEKIVSLAKETGRISGGGL